MRRYPRGYPARSWRLRWYWYRKEALNALARVVKGAYVATAAWSRRGYADWVREAGRRDGGSAR
jgi:hypothetical protein